MGSVCLGREDRRKEHAEGHGVGRKFWRGVLWEVGVIGDSMGEMGVLGGGRLDQGRDWRDEWSLGVMGSQREVFGSRNPFRNTHTVSEYWCMYVHRRCMTGRSMAMDRRNLPPICWS